MTEKQTVLVTGGCGFIGTNFVRLLVQSGEYRVMNLDIITYVTNPPGWMQAHTSRCYRRQSSSRPFRNGKG